MNSRLVRVAVLAAFVFSLALSGGAFARSDLRVFDGTLTSGGTAPAQSDQSTLLAAASEFRRSVGMRADAAWIDAVSIRADKSTAWGVPLTQDEAAELDRRFETQQHQDRLDDYLKGEPAYAGMYVDQLARGEFVVAFAGVPASDVRDRVASLLPNTATVRFELVQFAAEELESARANVAAFRDSQAGQAAGITLLGIDPVANRVIVGIDPYSDKIAAAIRTEFGSAVEVRAEPVATVAACTRLNCAAPSMKGGLHIYAHIDPVNDQNCTSGFMGRVNNNPVPGQWFLLTAGHCIKNGGGNGRAWFHNSVHIGSSVAWSFANGADADFGVIRMNQMQFPTDAVLATGPADIRQITTWVTNPNQTVGTLACRAGYKSDSYVCGNINAVNMTKSVSGTMIDHLYRTSVQSQQGDSGGSIMANSSAMGYASAIDAGGTWYSTIDWAILTLGYKPCRSPNVNPCT